MSPPKDSKTSRAPQPSLPLHKLSPRLAYLMSLPREKPRDELLALAVREAELLTRVERNLRWWNAGFARGATRRPPDPFAPLTAGVYLASGPWAKHSLVALFDELPENELLFSVMIASEAGRDDLAHLGAQIGVRSADVWTAFVPYSRIVDIVRSPLVIHVHLADAMRPCLIDALAMAGIDALHAAAPPGKGTGVFVGVADRAIDLHHKDFKNDDGTTRFVAFWDQDPDSTAAGAPPTVTSPSASFLYGIEYSTTKIQSELAAPYTVIPHIPTQDDAGLHGTAVLGCAAGNGASAPTGAAGAGSKAGPGAAPQADLIFVALLGINGSEWLIDEAAALAALAYIFARAAMEAPKAACVANFSYVTDVGPHDGTAWLELGLDGLLIDAGRAITLSAGNHHGAYMHKTGRVVDGASFDELRLDYASGAIANDVIEIWYDGHDTIDIEVWFVPDAPIGPAPAPNPSAPDPAAVKIVAQVAEGSSGSGPFDTAGSTELAGTTMQVTSTYSPTSRDNCIAILIVPAVGGVLPAGVWYLRLIGKSIVNGRFDAWFGHNNTAFADWFDHVHGGDDGRISVDTPATAWLPISVGNQRKSDPPPGPTTYETSPSSGRGPTRDSRHKPDLCAVGYLVTAPRANDRSGAGGLEYDIFSGTSISAPIVAGSCALLFECRGATATSGNIQQMLIDGAVQRAAAVGLTVPADDWGFGPLTMGTACSAPTTNVDVWMKKDALDDGRQPFVGEVPWLSPDIEILDVGGTVVPNPTHNVGARYSNRVRVTVRNRGSRPAYDTRVFLYWADPATSLVYPIDWNSSAIYTGAGFVNEGNEVTITRIDPDSIAAGVVKYAEFAWAPPAPGSNLRGDDHFCLLVRLENSGDRAALSVGSSPDIVNSNNLAQRNVLVRWAPSTSTGFGDADRGEGEPGFEPPEVIEDDLLDMPFYVFGDGGWCGLSVIVDQVQGEIELVLPSYVLPWREGAVLLETGGRRPRGQIAINSDPLRRSTRELTGAEIEARTDARGARALLVQAGLATFTLDENVGRLWIPQLLLAGVRVPARVRVLRPQVGADGGFVHVGQTSSGRRVGGVTLEIRR